MILIENATVVRNPLKNTFSEEESVVVDFGEILAVGEARAMREQYPNARRVNVDGCMLLPGLIDAHTHLYSSLTSGMPGTTRPLQNFPQVLSDVWWCWDKSLRDEDNYLSAVAGSIQSIRNGITTILDHHASPLAVSDSLSRVAAGVTDVGLRACLSYEVSDRDGPLSRNQGIVENARFHREVKQRKDNQIANLFGLHAVFSMSDETLKTCAETAADLETGCHMHVAEHRTEVEKFTSTHRTGIVEYLRSIGILGLKTILAHTVHISKEEIQILQATGTFNVYNPISNMNNGVGVAPIVDMINAGQPVGLGSDGFYDLQRDLLVGKLLQNSNHGCPSALSDSMMLKMTYENNSRFAERIFKCRFGEIEPGFAADMIMIAYDPFTPILPENLSAHVIAALMSGKVQNVIINGEIVMQDGELTRVDEKEVSSRSRTRAVEIWDRYRNFQSWFLSKE